MRIFACEHLTREAVWFPELTRHANTATRIDRVELVSANPRQAAEHMSRLIDRPITTDADGALRVTSGGTRGAFVFLDRATLEKRHPGVPLDGLPREGGVTLALRVDNADAAKSAVGGRGVTTKPGSITVPPRYANGVILELAQG
jgi:hypothetical protein